MFKYEYFESRFEGFFRTDYGTFHDETQIRCPSQASEKNGRKTTARAGQKETYTDKNGSVKTRNYDAHHVIENKFGGKAEWWNITPAMRGVEHQGGIQRTQGPAEKLFGR